MNTNRDRLKVGREPIRIRVESEPYAMFNGRQFVPVLDVLDVRKGHEYYLIISPISIGTKLYEWVTEAGRLRDIEFWINKQSDERLAKYELEF